MRIANDERIHQLVHGYRRGHELLAGSIPINGPDADLVLRLSDLSGSLVDSDSFKPYWTAYPLPSETYYVFAKTWHDLDASRSGVVKTHSLLVPMRAWQEGIDPLRIVRLFRKPDDLEQFLTPICLHDNRIDSEELPLETRAGFESFVTRYFVEGVRPVVWFTESGTETLSLAILRALWPQLKARFSFCTFSLQPRTLNDRPFDVLFAPKSAYSRFRKIDRDHYVFSGQENLESRDQYRWAQKWSDWLLDHSNRPITAAEKEIWGGIGPDPTELRRIVVFDDLNRRAAASGLANVGLLDVVESIAPSPDDALALKQDIVLRALRVSTSEPIPDAVQTFSLLADRLQRPAFTRLCLDVEETFVGAVSDRASRNFADFITEIGSSGISRLDSRLVSGMVKAAHAVAGRDPGQLRVIASSGTMDILFQHAPELSLPYLEASKAAGDSEAEHKLADWLYRCGSPELISRVRKAVLAEFAITDSHLLSVLINNISSPEVMPILDSVAQNPDLLAHPESVAIIQAQIASRFAQSTLEWAIKVEVWNEAVVSIVASSFELNSVGFDATLDSSLMPSRKVDVLVDNFRRLSTNSKGTLPYWFVRYASAKPGLLAALISVDSNRTTSLLRVYLESVPDTKLALVPSAISDVERLRTETVYSRLRASALRSSIREYVSGEIGIEVARQWLKLSGSDDYFREISAWEFRSLVSIAEYPDRIWEWLVVAPDGIYRREDDFLFSTIALLTRISREFLSIASNWRLLLRRAREQSSRRIYIHLAAQAVDFAFSALRDDASVLLAESFFDVHQSVLKEDTSANEVAFMFGIFDWDRSQELRRRLALSFLKSNWPPRDLAFACREPWLLRKLLKRLQRERRKGAAFIDKLLKDLALNNSSSDSDKLLSVVRWAVNDPDWIEDWI